MRCHRILFHLHIAKIWVSKDEKNGYRKTEKWRKEQLKSLDKVSDENKYSIAASRGNTLLSGGDIDILTNSDVYFR